MRPLLRGALALALAIPIGQAASGEARGFTRSELDWAPLDNARTYEFEGRELLNGDCDYQWPEILVEEGVVREIRVIGVDVDDCRLLLEDGTPQQLPEEPVGKGYRSDIVAADVTGDRAASEPDAEGVATLAASGRNWAFHQVQWLDPIGIATSSVQANLTWSWNGTCAYSPYVTGNYTWFGPSGWSRESYSVTQSTTSTCSWWLADARGTFRNGIFCAGQTTWAYYDYVRARGWNNGTVSVLRSSRVAGGCTALLNMRTAYGNQPA